MSEAQVSESFVAHAEQAVQHPDVNLAVLGPGAQLALHRQAKGWTIEQVADQLNLAARQIQALENDNYGALPGIVIARGFIRAYAKLLKVDATPLVALMTENNPAPMESIELRRALSASFSESRLPPMSRNGKAMPKWIIGALIVLAVLAIGLLAQRSGWVAVSPESLLAKVESDLGLMPAPAAGTTTSEPAAAAAASAPVVAAASDTVTNADKNAGSQETGTIVPMASLPAPAASLPAISLPPASAMIAPATMTPAPILPAAITPSTTAAVAPAAMVPASRATPAAAGNAVAAAVAVPAPAAANSAVATPAATASSKDKLILAFHEDSWVELRRADKSILISRLVKAGSTESFDIIQPAVLVVGNAAGVDASLRGKPVDLKAGAKNNIVRLDLK